MWVFVSRDDQLSEAVGHVQPSYHSPFSFLNLSQASFSVLNTAPAIMRCSVVAVVGSCGDMSAWFAHQGRRLLALPALLALSSPSDT